MNDYNPYETCDRCLLDTSDNGICHNCSYVDPYINPDAAAKAKEAESTYESPFDLFK